MPSRTNSSMDMWHLTFFYEPEGTLRIAIEGSYLSDQEIWGTV